MLYRILIFLNVFLMLANIGSCASIVLPYNIVDKELVSYYNEFKKQMNSECSSIKEPRQVLIELVDKLPDYDVGLCTYKLNGFKIQFKKEFWEEITEDERRELMYHEATHCLLNIDHTKDVNNYMYPEFNYIDILTVKVQASQYIARRCHE